MYKCNGVVYLELMRCEETQPECEAGLQISCSVVAHIEGKVTRMKLLIVNLVHYIAVVAVICFCVLVKGGGGHKRGKQPRYPLTYMCMYSI